MKTIKIGRTVLKGNELELPYIIAEAGVNHEGDMGRAKQMIEEVSHSGGNAIKFQAYKAGELASKDSPAYWDITKEPTKSQYELFKKHDKFWKKEFEELADYANHYNIDFLATPFDLESADFLEPLVPAYKIASADITNMPFIKFIARKGKPIILSTGASTTSEIYRALEWIEESGNKNFALLHCILNYPTKYEDANLGKIKELDDKFPNNIIGYSDHTNAERMMDVLIPAWLLGARIIEKHYTWDKTLPGNDHYHSMNAVDLRTFVEKMKFTFKMIGKQEEQLRENENTARIFARRSLVAKRPLPKGKTIEDEDITWKRPGTGIPPYMYDLVVGGTTLDYIEEDEILTYDKIRMKSH